MPKTDVPKTDDPKPDEPQGVKRADAGLTHAYEQIKSAEEDLARLDRLVSGMERGDGPSIRQGETAAAANGATVSGTPPRKRLENRIYPPSVRRGRAMLLALVGFLLATGIFGAAFASRYGDEAKAIMARWAPPAPIAHKEASAPPDPPKTLMAQAANAREQPSPPAAPSPREMKDVPSANAAAPSADRTSADLAQSLTAIAHDLAGINAKLDQLKSSHDQTLREHADAIQQLKTAQEQSARDNARIAGQLQAVQAQLAALSAKSPAQTLKQESEAAARQRQVVATPPRPRRPPPRWRPPPYMDERWDDSYW